MVLLSCAGKKDAKEHKDTYPSIFPDYVGVTIPSNISPLNFGVKDAECIQAEFFVGGKTVGVYKGKECVDIPLKDWKNMVMQVVSSYMEICVSVWTDSHPEGISYKPFRIYVSGDEIDGYVAYRLIPPGYIGWNKMELAQRCLSSFSEKVLVSNLQNDGGCLNCHTPCKGSPSHYLFHSRGKMGGTIVARDGHLSKHDIGSSVTGRKAVYPAWHPDGRWVAFTTDDVHQSFYSHCRSKIEVYNRASDLLLYDTRSDRVVECMRFCDTVHVETMPAFSPDGRYLYFCTSPRLDMPYYADSMRYSIVRVSFDPSTGHLGDKVDTVYNARLRGGSASLPRISPDGRWLLFSRADCGAFPIQHPEADLWQMELGKGELRPCTILNSKESEAYHCWSRNGHWVIFASRRMNGRNTRLYIAWFNNGSFGKPFMLPQRNPFEEGCRRYSYNVPEFVTGEVETHPDAMARLLQGNVYGK
jgi:hypothetical protein